MFTTSTSSFAQKAASLISLFVLVVGVFPAPTLANHGGSDACDSEFTYEKSGDFNDSRLTINFYDGDQKVDITANSGYALVSIQYDLENGGQNWVNWNFSGNTTTVNPSGSADVDDVRVVVKKVCFGVSINETLSCGSGQKTFTGSATYAGDTSTRLRVTFDPPGNNNTSTDVNSTNEPTTWSFTKNVTAGSTYTITASVWDNDNASGSPEDTDTWTFTVSNCAPPPPVDVCPNVTGVQTTTPCADTTCATDGGTWSNNQCVMPVMVDICHKTGNGWNQISVNENGWNGHGNHDDDFLVDANNPCPPVEEPTEQEVCIGAGNSWIEGDCYTPQEECEEIEEGFWNGTDCDDIEECEQGQTYNSANNTCTDPEPTEADACVLDGKFWTGSTCVDIAVCTGNQAYNPENNTCVDQYVPPTCAENQTLVEGQCVNNEISPENESSPEPEAPKKNRGHVDPVCNNNEDDDNDGLYDVNDPDCADANGSSESPAIGGTSEGDVLGACSAILDSYMGLSGVMADPAAVKILQAFLNKELGLTLEVSGEYDAATIEAVKAFQTKYSSDVLSPWGIDESTGIVYKTTQRMINKIACPTLDLPMPELN